MLLFLPFFLAILFNALLCDAAPFIAEKRAIDTSLLHKFELMSQYASAAYCSNNFNFPGDQIQCGSKNCALVEQADSATVLEFSKTETPTDVTGFLAIDHTNALIVLSFRGSQSLDNWLTNLNIASVPTDLCASCTAHAGFWDSWTDARETVLPAVANASMLFPHYAITVAGHSLGGAIATLAAAQLRNLGYSVALFTFGSPRVGGAKLSAFISGQQGGNYRVTHWNDPVPRVPLLIMGYVHVSPEYYIGRKSGESVGEGDVRVFEGSVNFGGNAKWLLTDVEAHRWYFGSMYTCKSLEVRGEVVARF